MLSFGISVIWMTPSRWYIIKLWNLFVSNCCIYLPLMCTYKSWYWWMHCQLFCINTHNHGRDFKFYKLKSSACLDPSTPMAYLPNLMPLIPPGASFQFSWHPPHTHSSLYIQIHMIQYQHNETNGNRWLWWLFHKTRCNPIQMGNPTRRPQNPNPTTKTTTTTTSTSAYSQTP